MGTSNSEPVVKTSEMRYLSSQLVLRNISVISYILMVYVPVTQLFDSVTNGLQHARYLMVYIGQPRFSVGDCTHENEYTRIYCLFALPIFCIIELIFLISQNIGYQPIILYYACAGVIEVIEAVY